MYINNKELSIPYVEQIAELENSLYPESVQEIDNKNYVNHPTFSVFTVTDENKKVKAFLLSKLVSTKTYERFEKEEINEEFLLNDIPKEDDETCIYFASIYSSLPKKTNILIVNTLEYFSKYNYKFAFSYSVTKKGNLFSQKHNLILKKDNFIDNFKLFYWTKDKLKVEYWKN